ncbi:MAG: methyl-accepting chemotaxis protein [Puniceicoccaceae bacterium]
MNYERTFQIFNHIQIETAKRVSRVMGYLLLFQWVVLILVALAYTPLTWVGSASKPHMHVYLSILLGGLVTLFPTYLAFFHAERYATRLVVAAGQLLVSSLLIHLVGGRIEGHFHIFASLAILSMYLDWRVILVATLVTGADHLLRGFFYPMSMYGVMDASILRTLEHVAYVVFEDAVLIIMIAMNRKQALHNAAFQSNVELEKQRLSDSMQEVGEKTRFLATAINDLRVFSKDTADNASHMELASSDVSKNAETLSGEMLNATSGLHAINDNTAMIASSVEEISASIREVARSCSDASEVASNANQHSQESLTIIREQNQNIKGISAMADLITQISTQTNLLALNATIEAASAGEAGKGFAVVAGEVKELALKSSQAAQKINEQIERIVADADRSFASMESIGSSLEQVNQYTHNIAAAIEEQSSTIDEVSSQITRLAQESDSVSQLVKQSVDEFTEMKNAVIELQERVSITSERNKDASANVDLLSGVSTELDGIVGRFKI